VTGQHARQRLTRRRRTPGACRATEYT
jgi:hypothetical protein